MRRDSVVGVDGYGQASIYIYLEVFQCLNMLPKDCCSVPGYERSLWVGSEEGSV